jgi:type II secretory pathway pseudopilin PulG
MFCQRCGNSLAPGARFCNKCGTPVTAPVQPVSMARPALVSVIAVFHFISATFMLIGGVILLASAFMGKRSEGPGFFAMGVVLLLFGALSLAAGIGLWKMRDWGRSVQIVLAVIGLLAIPLGTIVSILLLVYFTRPHIKLLFSGKRLDQLTNEERDLLAQHPAGSGASTAVVVVVVVFGFIAVMGILSAIAIPNLLTAMQRAKQKRTIADMRTISLQVESYRADHNNALPQAQSMPELASALHLNLQKDGWGNDLRYASDGTNYWLVSAGKDGRFETEDVTKYAEEKTTNFDADIVLENGTLLREPEVR